MRHRFVLWALVLLGLSACTATATPTPTTDASTPAPTCTVYASEAEAQAVVPFEVMVLVGPDAGTLERVEVCAPPYDVTLTYRIAQGGTIVARSWSPEGTYELPEDPLMKAISVQGYDAWQGEVIPGMKGILWEKGDGVIYAIASADIPLETLLQLRIQPGAIQ